ncbi:hypothetical protein EVAR_77787_1 [Eumeta japonica]|uniref:Uncharacterized protein n=1 Tax=Eumeta variegata TaxID=151549 RepID=A0A4C1TC02_EUMVA|nr:hypothetical protein EVAR_77787_1 [Eumeta japonica]
MRMKAFDCPDNRERFSLPSGAIGIERLASARGFARGCRTIPSSFISTDLALEHDPDRYPVLDSDPDLALDVNLSHSQFRSRPRF